MSIGTRLSLGLYSALVLTRGAWERGKPRDCTLYWCSPREPGNEASHELELHSDAHQGSPGTRLARVCTPYWFSPGEPGNEASPGRELCTSAPQESLGTRLAMGLHSVLVLIKGALEQG